MYYNYLLFARLDLSKTPRQFNMLFLTIFKSFKKKKTKERGSSQEA